MRQKTKGIILHYITFKETSVITKIYTEKFGVQSFIINGIRSKSSKKSLALFQPLTLLDLVVYIKKNENNQEGIKRISEYKSAFPFQSIPFDIKKSTIAIFITELISKSLKEDFTEEENIFTFLEQSIQYLDEATDQYESFHIHFMVQFARYIGFGITYKNDIRILSSTHIGIEDINQLTQEILSFNQNEFNVPIKLSNEQRKAILNLLLTYYSSHIEGFATMKSKPILEQIFS